MFYKLFACIKNVVLDLIFGVVKFRLISRMKVIQQAKLCFL